MSLEGDDVIALLREVLRQAKTRVYSQQFLINAQPHDDVFGEVRYLLHAFGEASARGVDVRIIVPFVSSKESGHDLNEAAVRFLLARGVPVRQYASSAIPQLHAKSLVADDDLVLVGNTNWTPTAFRASTEISVATRSRQLNASLCSQFLQLWKDCGHANAYS